MAQFGPPLCVKERFGINFDNSASTIPLRQFRWGLDVSREAKLLEDKSLAFVPQGLNSEMIEPSNRGCLFFSRNAASLTQPRVQ